MPPQQWRRMELKECAHCHLHEKARGDFRVCGGCKQVRYCGALCQREHWRAHKAACKAAAKTISA